MRSIQRGYEDRVALKPSYREIGRAAVCVECEYLTRFENPGPPPRGVYNISDVIDFAPLGSDI